LQIAKAAETRYTNSLAVFSTFLLQRNLPQMFALLMEPNAMIQVSILGYCETVVLLQLHRAVAGNFVPENFGLFRRNPWRVPRNSGIHWCMGLMWIYLYFLDCQHCYSDSVVSDLKEGATVLTAPLLMERHIEMF